MGRTRIAKAVAKDLIVKKETSQKRKYELEKYLSRLKESYESGKISYARYTEIFHKKNDGRNLGEWIQYYDKYGKECEKEEKKHKRKTIRKKVLTTFFLVAILSVLVYLFFFTGINFSLTGFAVFNQEKEFTQELNLNFTSSTTYNLQLENLGQLTSLKISGLIESQAQTDGEVKIYLDDILILDSSNIKESNKKVSTSSPGITGGVIDEETISEKIISNNSYSEQEAPSQEESSPSQEGLSTENSFSNSDSNSEEINQTIQTDSNQSSEEKENKTIKEGVNESKEESSPSQPFGPLLPSENETPNKTENYSNNELQEIEILIKEFKKICEETCDLDNLNLTKNSYTLRIEISNARLQLDSVNYKIIQKKENLSDENITVITEQYPAVLGQPVKWKKQISLKEKGLATIELPKDAKNIVVNKITLSNRYSEQEAPSQEESSPSQGGLLTENLEINEKKNKNGKDILEILIEDNSTEYEIEYETPAPYSTEEEISKGKKIFVSSLDEVHYENVLIFTNLSESLNARSPSEVKIHWIEENIYITPTKVEDKDANGIYDYVEFIAPHLSNQTFEIIVITKALHLNSNKEFISDIYEQVKEQDNLWSEEISNKEYIRVTFEVPLDNTKDITVYPRITNGNPRIEVYEIHGTEKIAEFSSLDSNNYNRIYLTNLIGTQDTFDLHILGGSVEFDHIIDPPIGTQKMYEDFDQATTDLAINWVEGSWTAQTSTTYCTNDDDDDCARSTTADTAMSSTNDLDLSDCSDGTLWVSGSYYDLGCDSGEYLDVLASANGGTNYYSFYRYNGASANGKYTFNVTLGNGNISSQFKLRFNTYSTDSGEYYYVDDIRVYCIVDTDNIPPTFTTIPNNASLFYKNESLSVEFMATDETSFGYYSVNDSIQFTLTSFSNGTGVLKNTTPMAVGNYEIKITINDTTGNINWTRYTIQVNKSQEFCQVLFNETSPLADTNTFTAWANCSSAFVLARNGTTIENNSEQTLEAGAYNFSMRRNDTGNYSYIYNENEFIMNVAVDNTPPQVNIIFPENNTNYDYHYSLPLNFSILLNEEGSAMYSIDNETENILGNTTMYNSTEGVLGTELNATLNTLSPGNYTFRIYANDTLGNKNYTEIANFTLTQENILVNGTIIDGENNTVNTTIAITDEFNQEVVYNSTDIINEAIIPLNTTYTIEIIPHEIETIENITFENVNFSEEEFEIELIDIDERENHENFPKLFALNNKANKTAKVHFTAQANALYKCANYNFKGKTCLGEWELYMENLEIGEKYYLTLAPGDPGYGIINITNAEHMNSSRVFISDIFEEVRELDDSWSETIPDGNYVRVVFEVLLNDSSDITIFPRTVSGNPFIEVYEKDEDILIANFTSINDNEYNQVLLTSLIGEQDTFDLHILGGSVEFNHIVDPTMVYNMNNSIFMGFYAAWGRPTSSNRWLAGTQATSAQYAAMTTEDGSVATNIMATGTSADEPFWRFNFSIAYNEIQIPAKIKWMYIKVSAYENGTDTGEAGTLYIFPSTNTTWITVGTIGASSMNNVTKNWTDPTAFSSFFRSGNLTLVIEGANFDAGDALIVDHVQLIIDYDNTNPWFTSIPENTSLFYGNQSLTSLFPAEDDFGIANWTVNDTANFSISTNGTLTNKTPLMVGDYAVNVTITDNKTNINWTIFRFSVNKSQELCQVLFNETSPLADTNTFTAWANCSTAFVLARNGTTIENASEQDLAAGAYNFSMRRNDTQNFTQIYNESEFRILSPEYLLKIITPNTGSPLSVSPGDNITIYFNFSNGETNITSGLSIDSVFIGGINATIVSGDGGSGTSYFQGFEAVTFPPTGWKTGGNGSIVWVRDQTAGYTVNGSADAAAIQPNDISKTWLNYTYNFESNGYVEFWWNVTCENNFDFLCFCEDKECADAGCRCVDFGGDGNPANGAGEADESITSSGANGAWTSEFVNYSVDAGTHFFTWCYAKDFTGYYGSDAGLLDNVTFATFSSSSREFAYIENVGWQVNVTVPDGFSGLQDLFINATYSGSTANDTQIDTINYEEVADTTSPTYSDNSTNNTLAGKITNFAIKIDDNSALHPNGRYIFSTNNTGSWENDTAVNFTSTPEWANVTKILNSTSGTFIGYRWYFNDSAGNPNSTEIYTLTTNEEITYLGMDTVQSSSTSGSSTVTIPSGATFCMIGVSYWEAYGDRTLSMTLDGEAATLITDGYYSLSHNLAQLWYVKDFSEGDKFFNWTWSGNIAEGAEFMFLFFDNVNLTDPIRDYDYYFTTSGASWYTTPNFDSSSTDMIVGVATSHITTINMTTATQTERITPGVYNSAQYSMATKPGDSAVGNMTAYLETGGIIGASLRFSSEMVTNNPPAILEVYNNTMDGDPVSGTLEGPSATYVTLVFNVSDPDGLGNLNNATAKINFTSFDGVAAVRENTSCAWLIGQSTPTSANFSCNITMWWWDQPGVWNISAYIADTDGNIGYNHSVRNFSVGATDGIQVNVTTLTWAEITPGASNQPALQVIGINNTGNRYRSLYVNSSDLIGETISTQALGANNFTVKNTAGCGGTPMVNRTDTNITSAKLWSGNYTYNNGTAQENLHFCLETCNADLSAQSYSTTALGTWIIKVLAIAIIPRRRKKKQKTAEKDELLKAINLIADELKEDKLLKAINLIADELKEEYSLNKKEAIEIIIKKLKKKYGLTRNKFFEIIKAREEITIPITIFTKELGALESLTKYMKENLNMGYREIAKELGRNERTIWTAYKKANEKQKEPIKIEKTEINLSASIFANIKLTPLESIVAHLKENGRKFSEIAQLLNRDQRNIWTIYSRAIKK